MNILNCLVFPALCLAFANAYTRKVKRSGDTPDNFDWRDHNVINPVKNQWTCGSCWAFAAIANVEAHFAIFSGRLYRFSEQEIMDCTTGVADTCKGAYPEKAFHTIYEQQGLNLADDYRYQGGKHQCRYNAAKAIKVYVQGVKQINNDEEVMKEYLYRKGPITVVMGSTPLHRYKGGIDRPTSEDCPGTAPQPGSRPHALLLVGYGVENGTKYWIARSSWGPQWGENGYYRVIRGVNACYIATHPRSVIISKHKFGPKP